MMKVALLVVLIVVCMVSLSHSPIVQAESNDFKALLSRLYARERESHDVAMTIYYPAKGNSIGGHPIELGEDFICLQSQIYLSCGLIDRAESITIYYGK